MTAFEMFYLGVEPLLPPLHRQVRQALLKIAHDRNGHLDVLDVGGRKSHYTIGVQARVSITDISRKSDVQKQLHLGITTGMAEQTKRRRSNLRWVLMDDMTQSSIKGGVFDVVVAVEVLEHVEQDVEFLREVGRVLKPGGVFIMTTPNGDYVANTNPDHKRHYTRRQLESMLRESFSDVHVRYAIKGGRFRKWGLRSWSVQKPVTTLLSFAGNVINSVESSKPGLSEMKTGTHHLFAVTRK